MLTQLLLGGLLFETMVSPTLEHSVLGLWTHPALSFRIQQAVSRSLSRSSWTSRSRTSSHRMHGAYLAPKCIRWVWKGPHHDKYQRHLLTERKISLICILTADGPIQKLAGSRCATGSSSKLVTSTWKYRTMFCRNLHADLTTICL